MKKRIFVLVLLLAGVLILSSCALRVQETNTPVPNQPINEDQPDTLKSNSYPIPTEVSLENNTETTTPLIPLTNSSSEVTGTITQTPTITLPLVVKEAPIAPIDTNIYGAAFSSVDTAGGLDQMTAAGLTWARLALSWQALEPTKGQPLNWDAVASVNQQIINAAQKSVKILLLIDTTPSWAKWDKYNCEPVDPNQLPAFADTMYQIVKHYSLPPYNIKYWEFWNEPDVDGFFGCWGDVNDLYYGGENYGKMLEVISPRIREADPQAKILIGGLLLDCDPADPPTNNPNGCLPSKFLEGILRSGAGDDFDGVSFHAYDFYYDSETNGPTYGNPNWHSSMETTGPVALAKASFLRQVLKSYGYTDKLLISSEAAVYCGKNEENAVCPAMNPEQYPDIRNIYLAESYASTLANGFSANIWYSVFGFRNSALLNKDLSPTEAYPVFSFSSKMLGTAKFNREINEYENVKGYEFIRDAKKVWILWVPSGATKMFTLPSIPSAIYDLNGNSLTISSSIVVDKHPIYIEW